MILNENDSNLITATINGDICIWDFKKKMADRISNSHINKLYSQALNFGAIGGKLLGAGGSGFLLIMANDHKLIEKYLNCRNLKLSIDQVGTTIIYKD